jgi:hypothetical protein
MKSECRISEMMERIVYQVLSQTDANPYFELQLKEPLDAAFIEELLLYVFT